MLHVIPISNFILNVSLRFVLKVFVMCHSQRNKTDNREELMVSEKL